MYSVWQYSIQLKLNRELNMISELVVIFYLSDQRFLMCIHKTS
jgi:hypothetical protein